MNEMEMEWYRQFKTKRKFTLFIQKNKLPPFLFSVGLFASLGVAIGNLSDLANQVVDANLPLASALEILLLKVPEFVTYSLPVSLLLATLITYGRLSSDSETVALQSCGVTLYRLFIPTFCLSLIVTFVTFLLNEYVVPNANYRATEVLVQKINKEANFWKTKDFYYPDYEIKTLENGTINRNLRSLFYAEQFDGKKMKTVTVIRWLKQELNQIIIADSARWNAPGAFPADSSSLAATAAATALARLGGMPGRV